MPNDLSFQVSISCVLNIRASWESLNILSEYQTHSMKVRLDSSLQDRILCTMLEQKGQEYK